MKTGSNKEPSVKSIPDSLKHMKGLDEQEKRLEAVRLIEQIEAVDVDDALQSVKSRMKSRRKTIPLFTSLTRIAAVLTLPLLIFTIWQLTSNPTNNTIAGNTDAWQEIQNPPGIRSKVSLPDGSTLWLNAESEIAYKVPFVRKNRQVKLSGEAYFDVKNTGKIPFTVKSGNSEITVLGTQFNVKAYPGEEQIEVALKEGSIRFAAQNGHSNDAGTDMVPNDYLAFNRSSGEFTLENKNIDRYISWHQNILIFDNTPMAELVRLIERWYGVSIEIVDDEIKRYHLNGTLEDETLRDVMEILQMTLKISYEIDNKEIRIYKSDN